MATREAAFRRTLRHARAALILLFGMLAGASAAFAPALAWAEVEEAGAPASREAAVDARMGAIDPMAESLRQMAGSVRALVADRLDAGVAPQALFDVALDDEAAVALEVARLRALLRDVDADSGAQRDASRRQRQDADASDAVVAFVSPDVWQARIELDRARLAFYALSPALRRERLAVHHPERSDASAPSGADLRDKEAEAQRDKALQAAREARSEAERLVAEEFARLLDVERVQAQFEKKMDADGDAIAVRREATLGWQRRAREARAPGAIPEAVDATYEALRNALRSTRDNLDRALTELSDDTTGVPQAGADPLANLQTTVDTAAPRAQRHRVEATATRLADEEKRLREEQAAQLFDEVGALNRERLALLPYLSNAKRSAITGFAQDGADQAASELRQLTLIVRYHRHAATSWLTSVRHSRKELGLSVGGVVLVGIEWTIAIVAFFWTRKRTPLALSGLHKRGREADRHERLVSPSLATRAPAFLLRIHRPIEWLVLALILSWLLPSAAKELLEVQLVTLIVQWVLGGALVVVIVNAIAGKEDRTAAAGSQTAALRYRSLRLVGRVVVTLGLVLVLTSRLVGPGTIYEWVLSTCWIASLPVGLVLLRWWREEVFSRTERTRKKSSFERWVLANRAGWKSVLAATGGGVYLFTRGALRAIRSWIGRFNITRRVLAYLFRRELGKLEAERAELSSNSIPAAAFDALGPEAVNDDWVSTDVDTQLEELQERLRERRGGVIALVGARGMGKSVCLRRLHRLFPDTRLIATPAHEEGALPALTDAVPLGLPAEVEAAVRTLAGSTDGRALLLDDAQRFVRPMMGGLAELDAVLATARSHSITTTWVFAMDEVIWRFLERARGARPLFDEVIHLHPWREEQIVELLRARTGEAGVTPSFERLLDTLPPGADEIDKQEALSQRATSYYRMLWDYAAGNPGVALHMWRRSLGVDEGGRAHVRFFQAPHTADLELLPDGAVFVLRAVLQLAPASPADIGRATMLSSADVADALRYALARDYLQEIDGRYTVTWTWFRAISLFLQRRHLLVTP